MHDAFPEAETEHESMPHQGAVIDESFAENQLPDEDFEQQAQQEDHAGENGHSQAQQKGEGTVTSPEQGFEVTTHEEPVRETMSPADSSAQEPQEAPIATSDEDINTPTVPPTPTPEAEPTTTEAHLPARRPRRMRRRSHHVLHQRPILVEYDTEHLAFSWYDTPIRPIQQPQFGEERQ